MPFERINGFDRVHQTVSAIGRRPARGAGAVRDRQAHRPRRHTHEHGRGDSEPDILVLLLLAALLVVPAGAAPAIDGVSVFPNDHIWNARVDALPVDANSALYVSTIGAARTMHADFGSGLWDGGPIGIPYVTVPGTQPKVPVTFEYARRERPRPVPDPAGRADRVGLRSPHPRPRPGPPAPVRGLRGREAIRRLVAGGLGRGLRPRLLTRSGPKGIPRPMRPGSRSCPASSATTRLPPARSPTPSGSRRPRPAAPTSGPRATTPRA